MSMPSDTQLIQSRLYLRLFPWIVCALGAVFYAYEYLLRITPNVITYELMQSYQINAAALGNLAGFYYYAYTPMQLPVGLMMDKFGPRRLLTVACLLCAVGSYLFAGTTVISVAAFGRFLVGFGSAFAFVGVLKLATIWLPPNRFALISGIATALGALGGIVGEVALEKFVNDVGWRSTVLICALMGIVLAIMLGTILRDSRHTQRRAHVLINWREVWHGLWLIIKNRQIWLNGLIGCLLYLPISAFAELWGKPYLEVAHGFSSLQSAYAVSTLFAGFAVGGMALGFLSDHLKNRKKVMFFGALAALIAISLILSLSKMNPVLLFLMLFIFGFSFGVEVIVFAIGRELSLKSAAATAVAFTNMLVMLGGAIFQPTIGALVDYFAGADLENATANTVVYGAHAYTMAMLVLPAVLMIALGLITLLKETHAELSYDHT